MLNKYFDKTYLINLERRPDRLASVSSRCESIGLIFERFDACDGAKENLKIPTAKEVGQHEAYWNLAAAGLAVTLIRIFEKAKAEKYDSVLILEDDVEFHKDVNSIVENNFKDIPADWETIYFGANHLRPYTHLTPHIAKLNGAYTTHCHAVRSTVFDLMLEELNKFNNPVDVVYANKIHTRGKSYVFRPHLAYQIEDYSDIVKHRVDYKFLRG